MDWMENLAIFSCGQADLVDICQKFRTAGRTHHLLDTALDNTPDRAEICMQEYTKLPHL